MDFQRFVIISVVCSSWSFAFAAVIPASLYSNIENGIATGAGEDDNGNYTCDPYRNGAFPHPINCEKYYDCYNGRATPLSCSSNLLFDLVYSGCNYPGQVYCGDRLRPDGSTDKPTVTPPTGTTTQSTGGPGFVCPSPWGYFSHPTDCSKFYECDNGVPSLLNCPAGLHFDPTTAQCDWPEIVKCQVS